MQVDARLVHLERHRLTQGPHATMLTSQNSGDCTKPPAISPAGMGRLDPILTNGLTAGRALGPPRSTSWGHWFEPSCVTSQKPRKCRIFVAQMTTVNTQIGQNVYALATGRLRMPQDQRRLRQETVGGQRCARHSSQVANPAGGPSTGSLPSSSPGVGMSMLAAHSTSS